MSKKKNNEEKEVKTQAEKQEEKEMICVWNVTCSLPAQRNAADALSGIFKQTARYSPPVPGCLFLFFLIFMLHFSIFSG